MNMSRSTYRAVRQNILTSTGAVLAVLLGSSPTLAQNLQNVRADAARPLVNQQANRAPTTADANDTAQVISSEPVLSSSVSVTGTVTTATARSNRADQSLSLNPLDLTSDHGPTNLLAGDDHAVADTGVAVVNHQSLRGAPVKATSSAADSLERAYAFGDVDFRR